ncbi:O-antigen ligase family protein [Actibacterium ureilyticum]|uniref:O-antigen ligase family protein n=1 Tax=Actibacterium ureilyticum TaxID=1590614 RepID=UPI000BAB06FF|nr:O-antigen ligase family protein [Actibacterium ureilyticum]
MTIAQTNMATGRLPARETAVPYGWLITLFYISILTPVFLNVGSLSLPPYRLLLLLTFFPSVFLWVTGRLGERRMMDVFLIMFSLWAALTLFKAHSFGSIYKVVGYNTLETAGAYFLGRMVVQNPQAFVRLVRDHFLALLVMLPLALLETQTGDPLVISFLGKFLQTHPIITYEPRLGLERAQVLFQHPIIFGLFSAAGFGLFWKVFTGGKSFLASGTSIVSAVCSVSSGAIMVLLIQWIFTGYDWVMRRVRIRWLLFFGVCLFLYIAVDIMSNRSPFHVFVSYLTLNSSTGYNRIRIWEYGIQNVKSHPIFGIGMRDWVRPRWMSASVDNHWLLMMMRHGYIGGFLFTMPFAIFLTRLSRANLVSDVARRQRQGILISMGALLIGASTVFLWGPIYVWLMFFLGASVWLLSYREPDAPEDSAPQDAAAQGTRYTRFAPKSRKRN